MVKYTSKPVKDFDQAAALVRRLMEDAGGSADAYEKPLPSSNPTRDSEQAEETCFLPDSLLGPQEFGSQEEEEDDGSCADGMVDWDAVGNRVWTNPPPVDDGYSPKGVVEDSEELLAIYKGFEKARRTNEPQAVRLETGVYQIERPWKLEKNWKLIDPVKDRLYLAEDVSGTFDIVSSEDLFIWVMPDSNRDGDLGYIHMGYVFLRKA